MVLKCWIKIAQVVCITLNIVFTLTSIGVMGKQYTYFQEVYTEDERDIINDQHGNYLPSLRATIAWDVFILIFVPIYTYLTWWLTNGKCTLKIMHIVYFVCIWFPRVVIGLVYIHGSPDLKKDYNDIKQEMNDDDDFCDNSINIRTCALTNSYLLTIDYEIFYIVQEFILGLSLIGLFHIINARKETGNSANSGSKYEDRGYIN
ncbi:hypothetical protein PPERSA_09880 [Pseudocohnilembus persalinus]|uniref:Uncharacterized protein n=1 Tax=Pseudocohnilembus persalinus TaxID=266149 RepID=A0A0V0QTT1_PSEPJ|nr:hypothetical protein PPERSA_09880 [Pseudocohnilembus persalinus]|eukprot:KRX05740.1 hypothetical protein PPERSA_09880 [Pseudocohnilembus persalinus]